MFEMKSDAQLLCEYVDDGAEAPFTQLVNKYTNLVYSAAARQADSPDTAAEITQRVFIGLARSAQSLSPRLSKDASLAGWLCRSARNISLNVRRDEFRRHSRERHAMEQLDTSTEIVPDWERIRPVLDEAMSELKESDYDAVVMRFFNNQDFQSVGQALGITEDTAQKRVSRALDKLREHLLRRGIGATATALSTALTSNAVQSAPAGLAASICSSVCAGSSIVSALSVTTTKAVVMTMFQKTLIGFCIVAFAATPLVVQHQKQAKLREQNLSLQQQVDQLAQLATENERLSNLLTQLSQPQHSSGGLSRELLRLRGEVGLLRQQNQGLAKLLADRQQNTSAAAFEPSSSWTDAGNATPEAAADTFAWAIKTTNLNRLAEVLVFETDQTDTNRLLRVEDVTKDFQPLMSEIEASRLILTDDSIPDQVTYWYQSRLKDGHTMVSPITLRRVDGNWRVKLTLGGPMLGGAEAKD
jgi:RNA polymerase sigma factor (sigma-70 family)